MHKITPLKITHVVNFEEITSIEDLEIVSEEIIWQNFERLAAFIFEKNEFKVITNSVKTGNKKRRQYDVIAWKSNQTFLVECKKWAGNRYRLSALKKAVEQHKERTTFYESIMNEDAIPVVVTLVEEEIRLYEGVPLVPIQKLNSFIYELDLSVKRASFGDYDDILDFTGDYTQESPEAERFP
jgi:Holliday junction resolvase